MNLVMLNKIIILSLCLFTSGVMALTLTSTAFQNGGDIPSKYTCVGKNINPPLSWSDIPSNTQSFVLIMSDPDAPTGEWNHWIIYNLPASSNNLDEGTTRLPDGIVVLGNSWNHTAYDGPCPPNGTHHYWFYLYALNTILTLPDGASKSQLESAMQNNIIDQTTLMGTFSK